MNVHICGFSGFTEKSNFQKEIINLIFPTEIKGKEQNCKKRLCKNPKWNAFIVEDDYKGILTNIQSEIKIANDIKKNEHLNNMILCFADEGNDKNLLEIFNPKTIMRLLGSDFPMILFIFEDTTKSNTDYKNYIKDYTYIKCLNLKEIDTIPLPKEEKNKSKLELTAFYLKLFMKYHFDNYFNEYGFNITEQLDIRENKYSSTTNLTLLLVGNSGTGKSTFVNFLVGKRISKESGKPTPVSTKRADYDIEIPDVTKNGDALIKIIDTPGSSDEKDLLIQKNALKEIFEDFKKRHENIPLILYFLQYSGRTLGKEKSTKNKLELEILEFINEKKIPIIFVVNFATDDTWGAENDFVKYLKENKLGNLILSIDPNGEEDNIIPINIKGRNIFGIKKLFNSIKILLSKKDPQFTFNETVINDLKLKFSFDEKLEYLKSKTPFFDTFESHEMINKINIFNAKLSIAGYAVSAGASGFIPIPFLDVPIVAGLLATSILSTAALFGYKPNNLVKRDILSIIANKEYKPPSENSNDSVVIGNKAAIAAIIIENLGKIGIILAADDSLKTIPVAGTIIGGLIGTVINTGFVIKFGYQEIKYFKGKFMAEDGLIFFTNKIKDYESIFRQIDGIANKYN